MFIPLRRAPPACEKGKTPIGGRDDHAGPLSNSVWAGLILFLGLTACSGSAEPAGDDRNHTTSENANVIGRHVYHCDPGGLWIVDFLQDGLSVDLAANGEKPVRLTAPAQGLTYVGEHINARVSGRDMHVQRSDRPPLKCRRT
ncbi:hypothetical protein [Sphingomonas sp. Root1294]|uniref:hypothetical protein n=1 Tax=Sphingomonas sp. Root1294 TaxID=1736447 RepID=UPI001F313DBD|nr:hypothetical protein [Sphingomonas sp. Root1294]